jgi:hypothetical protein
MENKDYEISEKYSLEEKGFLFWKKVKDYTSLKEAQYGLLDELQREEDDLLIGSRIDWKEKIKVYATNISYKFQERIRDVSSNPNERSIEIKCPYIKFRIRHSFVKPKKILESILEYNTLKWKIKQ